MTYLTEIKKDGKLHIGKPIKAESFNQACFIASQRSVLTRVIGEWLFTLTDITDLEANQIIKQLKDNSHDTLSQEMSQEETK